MQRIRFGRGFAGGFALQQIIIGDVPVRDAAAAARADYAVIHAQLLDRRAKLRAGARQQQFARFGGRVTKSHAGFFDGAAAGGDPFIRTERGNRGHQLDSFEIHVEFFGDNLPQRGEDALADFDLARTHSHSAVSVDIEPLAEVAIGVEAAGQRAACAIFRSHCYFLISTAARFTARNMRWCVPQRHRFFDNACFTSASLGDAFTSSNALADMMMPVAQ